MAKVKKKVVGTNIEPEDFLILHGHQNMKAAVAEAHEADLKHYTRLVKQSNDNVSSWWKLMAKKHGLDLDSRKYSIVVKGSKFTIIDEGENSSEK